MLGILRTRVFVKLLPALRTQLPSTSRFLSSKPIETKEKLLASNDPDVFGNLSIKLPEGERDEDDLREENFIQNPPSDFQKLGIRQYADMMKDFFKNGKVFEAIDVIETRMIKEDRVPPTNYLYNIAIDGCAKVGYTKKAFSLFNRMRERGLTITGATYTSLFNACAMSQFPKDALERAHRLREIMLEKNVMPNLTNYHAMIKAFGRLGDLPMAFQIVDEMQTQKLPVRVETFNFLLQACASDKELGFRHALLVWQKMHRRRMKPDIFSFNLMLRVTRDCGLGDVESTEGVLKQILEESKSRREAIEDKSNQKMSLIGSKVEEKSTENTEIVPSNPISSLTPNFLSPAPRLGNLIAISEVTKPEDRFLLVGGLSGFLCEMDQNKVHPDIKTCTELLEVVPSTTAAEKVLLRFMKDKNIKADIDFFNMLIKRRSLRFDLTEAQKVLKMIKSSNLQPDIMTYGVLALGCRTFEQAQGLLAEMEEKGIRPNIQILGAMFRQGTGSMNFDYALGILEIIKQRNFRPSETLIRNIYRFRSYLNFVTKSTENSPDERRFREDVKRFKASLNDWLKGMELLGLPLEEAIKKNQIHPYKQFKEPAEKGFESEKNTLRRHWKKRRGKLSKIE